jgi:serine/threonine-protein kinase
MATRRLGTVLRGKYHLDRILGVGGMAVVYRATHRNQAVYAIKMLLPEHSANENIRRRFLREGYAANSVKHPGTVRVVDDDISEDGAAFLVLELLDGIAGDRLAARMGGRLSLAATCALALQVLDVLEAAHEKGIIHRDIKPANLFVLRDGTVKVFDFGIARVRETLAGGPGGTHTTGGGMLLGTPAFMAPEQAIGQASEVDARADLWGLGATFFALASGTTVHEGDSGQQLLVSLVTRSPRSLAAALPDAPSLIVEIVDKALAFDRDRRWSSAKAMRQALEEASRAAFDACPGPEVLATCVPVPEPSSPSLVSPTAVTEATPVPEPGVRQGPRLLSDTPTQPAAGSPNAVVETSRPVSRDGQSLGPHRSIGKRRYVARSVWLIGGVAAVAVAAAVAGVLAMTAKSAAPRRAPAAAWTAASAGDTPSPIVLAPTAALGSPAPFDAPASSTEGRDRAWPAQRAPGTAATMRASAGGGKPKAASADIDAASNLSDASTPNDRALRVELGGSPGRGTDAAEAADATNGATTRPTPSGTNCNPPFYYDESYNRVFKKECL